MYQVILSNDANNDINQIVLFIATESGSKKVALDYLDKLQDAILSLNKFPERGSNPRYKILRNQGYKFIVVETHLVFYKIKEENKTIIIYRVLHQKSSYQNFL
ncbi:MAG: type II toxin-antitoxin system RelE/ParE family toxin [Acholeplasmataceae bacterium]|nr:type II toxin-antitoxin system RelE/ParE family toxin [Acholeplasmataceae bacterium]